MPRRAGHNLHLRLATRKEDALRFPRDPAAPFANNQAEHDVRMMKLRQKIFRGFLSLDGATDFALIRSFLSTAKKETGLEHHRRPDPRPHEPGEILTPLVSRSLNLGS